MHNNKLTRICSFLLVLAILGNYVVISSAEENNSNLNEQLTSGNAHTVSGDANNASGDAVDSTIDLTEYEYREVIEEGSLVTIRGGEISNIENIDVTILSTLSEDFINTMSDSSLKTELLENGTKYIDKNSVRYRQCNLKIAQDDIFNYFKKFYFDAFGSFCFGFNRDIDFKLNRIEVLWWTELDRDIPDNDVYPTLNFCVPHPNIYNVVEPNTNGWCSLIYTKDCISSQTGDYEYEVSVRYILYPKPPTTITPEPINITPYVPSSTTEAPKDKTKPTVKGVKNKKIYKKAVTIKFSDKQSGIKKATLNGKKIKTGKKVNKNGKYTLKVYDKAGNCTTVKFTIKLKKKKK